MNTIDIERPDTTEYAPSFQGYITRVPETLILPALETQIGDLFTALSGIAEEKEHYRYAEGKWSTREVAGHLIDCERVMGYRALCIARGEAASLPGFDENDYARNSPADAVPLKELLQEFEYIRRSHLLFFRRLSREAWLRMGTANKAGVSVRALAWIMTGHVRHHLHVLNERYLAARQP